MRARLMMMMMRLTTRASEEKMSEEMTMNKDRGMEMTNVMTMMKLWPPLPLSTAGGTTTMTHGF
jgi:hypothetical protein